MPAINYRELKRRYETDGPAATIQHLREALEQKHLKPEDFSIRDIAEATLGPDYVRALEPRGEMHLVEAGETTDQTAFSHITGQVIYSKIMEAYDQEAFIMSRLVDTIPTRLDGERIPGVGRIRDDIAEVRPGMPYPALGFGEDYIDTPSTTKRGFIVPVTKEALFFDRTHLVLQRAQEVGEILGLNKEKRLLDLALGITNNYTWKGTAYDTYQAATPWINTLGTNELADWTDVDAAEQLQADILDPNTGEPILIQATQLLVMPAYRHAANRVIGASEIRYTVSGAPTETTAPNPMRNYAVHDSRLAYRRLIASGISASDAKKYWYIGNFRRAFAYMQNWPITVTQAPPGSEAEFTQDILLRFKASERGAAAVINPRYVVKSTG